LRHSSPPRSFTVALLSDVAFQRDGTQRKLEHAGIISVRNKNTLMVNMYDEGVRSSAMSPPAVHT
jgi:ribosome recycling factor